MKSKIWLLIVLVVFLLLFPFFLPWWSMAIPCLGMGFLVAGSSKQAFLLGTSIVFIIWLAFTLYFYSISDGFISSRIALTFYLPNKYLLFLISSFVGGLVGGFSALAGFHLRNMKRSDKEA
jgi:hypothetical protein